MKDVMQGLDTGWGLFSPHEPVSRRQHLAFLRLVAVLYASNYKSPGLGNAKLVSHAN